MINLCTLCRTVTFAEYGCMGPGASNSQRVWYSKQLDKGKAAPYMDISYIDGADWVVPPVGRRHRSIPCDTHNRDSHLKFTDDESINENVFSSAALSLPR